MNSVQPNIDLILDEIIWKIFITLPVLTKKKNHDKTYIFFISI